MTHLNKKLQLLLLFICAATYSLFAASANVDGGPARQFLYTISNSSSGNSVLGYQVGSNGSLLPLPGSPYSTNGLGQGLSLLVSGDSGIVVSADQRFLFAPNRGSNTIAVFRIGQKGILTSVPGSPFPTGGITPTSLALHENLLFVSHTGLGLFANCSGCDYRGFRVSRSGRLAPIEGATIKLSETPPSAPFAIRFSPDGRFLIGTETVASKINVYEVERDAKPGRPTLIPVPGSPFNSIGKLPLGFYFNPNNPTHLFVSNLEAVPGVGSVSSYLLANSGQIAPIESPVPSGQTSTCWVNVTSDGKWLFATNTDSDSIGAYGVAVDGKLTLASTTLIPRNGVPNSSLIAPVDMAITSGDKFLYVLTRDVATIMGFKIGPDSKLTAIGSTKIVVADAFPFGIVTVNLAKLAVHDFSYDQE